MVAICPCGRLDSNVEMAALTIPIELQTPLTLLARQ